jgi:hypothetical protein
MAFNPAPSNWIANWAEDGTNITVPLASFAEVTAAEADGTTGDIRKVMFAVIEHMYQEWLERATADRPTQMTMSKSVSYNTSTDIMTNTYTFTFRNSVLSQDVAAEPS